MSQIRPRNVTRLIQSFDHMMQSRQNEQISLLLEAGITLLEAIQDLIGKLNVSHGAKVGSRMAEAPGLAP